MFLTKQTLGTVSYKLAGLNTLIRPRNIIPSAILSAAGGIIARPNLLEIIKTPSLLTVPIIITIAILCNSMILNDFFDIHVDRYNNPTRPLVTGQVTRKEALIASAFLYILSESLSRTYLNHQSALVVRIMNLMILLYTPIFKNICFIKNIACAGIIAATPLFSGLSMSDASNKLLWMLSCTIFAGSVSLEIVLDIRDVAGDMRSNINTLPVVFGKEFAYHLTRGICLINMLTNFVAVTYLYSFYYATILLVLQHRTYTGMKHIYVNSFNTQSIKEYADSTTFPLISTLVFYCVLALYRL